MTGQGGLSDRDRLAFSPYLNIDSGALSNADDAWYLRPEGVTAQRPQLDRLCTYLGAGVALGSGVGTLVGCRDVLRHPAFAHLFMQKASPYTILRSFAAPLVYQRLVAGSKIGGTLSAALFFATWKNNTWYGLSTIHPSVLLRRVLSEEQMDRLRPIAPWLGASLLAFLVAYPFLCIARITNRPPLPPVRVPDAVRPRANRMSLIAPEQRAVKLGLWLQWRGVNLGRSAPLFDRGVRGLWRLPADGASASAAPAPTFLHSLRRLFTARTLLGAASVGLVLYVFAPRRGGHSGGRSFAPLDQPLRRSASSSKKF